MADATPTDVQTIIDTAIAESEIQSFIDDAAWEAAQAVDDYAGLGAEGRAQLEKYLAALKIVQTKDPRAASATVGTVSHDYAGDPVAWLRAEVDKRDPSGDLADTSRRSASIDVPDL